MWSLASVWFCGSGSLSEFMTHWRRSLKLVSSIASSGEALSALTAGTKRAPMINSAAKRALISKRKFGFMVSYLNACPGRTMEPQRLSLMTADNPIALRARCGSPGSDVNQGSRPPRDTACGFLDGDFAVLLYISFLGQTPIHPGVHRPQVHGKEREYRYRSRTLRVLPPKDWCAGRVRALGAVARRGVTTNDRQRGRPGQTSVERWGR